MNDEIKARLVKYADQLENAASKGAEFVGQHAPETVHQYLAWHFWFNVMSAVGCLVLFAAIAYAMAKLIGFMKRNDLWEVSPLLMFPLGGLIAVAFGFFFSVADALKIAIAPNVFIIEKLAELVK